MGVIYPGFSPTRSYREVNLCQWVETTFTEFIFTKKQQNGPRICYQFRDSIWILVQNHTMYVESDTKDTAKKRCQLPSAFFFTGIDRRCRFHIIPSETRRLIWNRTTAFDIVQEMSKNRVKQLNRRCDACSRMICFIAAVIDGVSDLGL